MVWTVGPQQREARGREGAWEHIDQDTHVVDAT